MHCHVTTQLINTSNVAANGSSVNKYDAQKKVQELLQFNTGRYGISRNTYDLQWAGIAKTRFYI